MECTYALPYVRDIWMINASVKFEERSLNPSKVIALTTNCDAAAAAALLTKTTMVYR